MNLWNYIREKMLEHPDQLVCEDGVSMTYEELCVYAEEHGKTLRAPYYAILCSSEMATAMALLSCIAAGKIAVPLPTRYGAEYYRKLLKAAQPCSLITDFFGYLGEYPVSSNFDGSLLKHDPAVILFTSGSTGTPKGVMLSGENLLSNIKDIGSYFPIGKQDTILIARPLYHSSVLTGEFLLSLCSGAKIVFSSEPFQPLRILNLMREHGVTVYGSTPTLLSAFARFVCKENGLSIRLLSISGECMTGGMARAIRQGFPNADVYCGYGLSEASPRVAYLPPALFDQTPTLTGVPVKSVKLRIVDNDGSLILKPMQSGELLVQGLSVMQGYFNDEARTKTVLMDGWLHTGDMAYWDHSGMLCVQGRKDDMIIRAGMNIYPAELENVLSADSRVQDVLIYGYEERETQAIGMKISGDFSNLEEVRALCREKLPNFQIPSKIELVDTCEVSWGGKKNKNRKGIKFRSNILAPKDKLY